jgi:hypothetical protein
MGLYDGLRRDVYFCGVLFTQHMVACKLLIVCLCDNPCVKGGHGSCSVSRFLQVRAGRVSRDSHVPIQQSGCQDDSSTLLL